MLFGYTILLLLLAVLVWDSVRAIRQKKWLRLLGAAFVLPMFAFFAAVFAYGGAPANGAADHFSGYIPGHFYVVDHGNYLEVLPVVFHRMQVLEIAAFISLAAAIVCLLLSFFIEKTDKKGP